MQQHKGITERTSDNVKAIENRDVAQKMEDIINTLSPKDDTNHLQLPTCLGETN